MTSTKLYQSKQPQIHYLIVMKLPQSALLIQLALFIKTRSGRDTHQLCKQLDASAKSCSREIWIHAARRRLDHRVTELDVGELFHEARLKDHNQLIDAVQRQPNAAALARKGLCEE